MRTASTKGSPFDSHSQIDPEFVNSLDTDFLLLLRIRGEVSVLLVDANPKSACPAVSSP